MKPNTDILKTLVPIAGAVILTTASNAAVLAQYNFVSVTNPLSANASAGNVAAGQPGLTVSTMTVVGGDGNYSISSTTNTAYGQGGSTPAIADIYTATIPR